MNLRRLRWLGMLIPAVVLLVFEYLRYCTVALWLGKWGSVLLTLAIVFPGTYLFSRWVFHVVEQMEQNTLRQARRAHALLQVAQAINSSLEVKTILQRAVDLSREHLDASYGEIHFLTDGMREHGVRFSGLTAGSCPVRQEPTLAGLNGEVLHTGRAIRLDDRSEHLASIGELPPGHPSIGPFLGVPILVRGRADADLLLIRPAGAPPFTQEDQDFLQIVAHHAAVAVENAKLYQEVYHLAALEERNRLGREMHDGLAQTLGYLNLRLRAATDQLAAHQETIAFDTLIETRRVVKYTYEEVRQTIFDLRSRPDPNLEFLPALQEYLYEFGLQSNLITDLVAPDDALYFLPGDEVQLIRIIQEALANVRRHAHAEHVWVRLKTNNGEQVIIVEDDGQGFDPQVGRVDGRPHFGLQTMRERAESIGGQLSIDTSLGQGTRVVVQLAPDRYHERWPVLAVSGG